MNTQCLLNYNIFNKSAYKINNINTCYQLNRSKESISFVIDHISARCIIIFKQKYKIDFTQNDTFYNILKFDAINKN